MIMSEETEFERNKKALRDYILNNKEKVAKDLEEMREKSNQNNMSPKEKEYNRFKQVCMIKNNAKQKAEELVWKFGKSINKLEMTYSQAKECALIAVDEIIENLVDLSNGEFTFISNVQYWQEVKQEIELL